MKANSSLSFRVYPENRTLYFRVNIWPTKRDMKAHCRDVTGKFEAVTQERHTYRWRGLGKPGRLLPCMGEVNFYRGYIGAGVVAHEILHAALRWIERLKVEGDLFKRHSTNASSAEERLCYGVGQMVDQFTHQCLKHGLTTTPTKDVDR